MNPIFDTTINIEPICRLFHIDISDIDHITLMRYNSKHQEEYMRIYLQPYYYHPYVPFLTADNFWIVLNNKDIIGKNHIEDKKMECLCCYIQAQDAGLV